MLAIRHFTRALPRTLVRLPAQSATRPLSALCHSSRLQNHWRTASRPSYALFSTSPVSWGKEGDVDQELSAKLESELQMEQDMSESDVPANIKDFLDNSPFELQDTTGQEEVILTRSFGDEKIRITFNIADLTAIDPDSEQYSEDKALYDEAAEEFSESTQSGGAQSKATTIEGQTNDGNVKVVPEEPVVPADRPELANEESPEQEDEDPSFPARVNITIEKPNSKGAVQVEAVAQDGMIVIDNVYYFPKAELADAKTANHDWERRTIYTGPPYGNLDQDLQVLLERYLDERGINTALALWIPEYIDYKEQREYINWLSEFKGFIDA